MIAEISAVNVKLESRLSFEEWTPSPHFLGQINSVMVQLSHFLRHRWTVASGFGVHVTPCWACFSWLLFSTCSDLTFVLIFKQLGWFEVFQNLGSFERSHLPSVSCSVFQYFLFSVLHHWPGAATGQSLPVGEVARVCTDNFIILPYLLFFKNIYFFLSRLSWLLCTTAARGHLEE